MLVALLGLTLLVQATPAGIEKLAREGWDAARAAALKGGSPESLAPAAAVLAEIDKASAATSWVVQGVYAHELIAAAMAAAMDERAEMELHIIQARELAERLQGSRYPAIWPLPIDEAEGELWFEVDQYAEALRAYQRAVQRNPQGGGYLGIARSAARLGNTAVACDAYKKWVNSVVQSDRTPGFLEARDYVARCQ